MFYYSVLLLTLMKTSHFPKKCRMSIIVWPWQITEWYGFYLTISSSSLTALSVVRCKGRRFSCHWRVLASHRWQLRLRRGSGGENL